MKIILGVTGQIGAGKTSVAELLSEQIGCNRYSFGKMIETILQTDNIQTDQRKTLQEKGIEIIEELGYDGIAQKLLDFYNVTSTDLAIIEGIRHKDVHKYYKKLFSGAYKLIYVECPKLIRLERLSKRPGRTIKTLQELEEAESHKVEMDTANLITLADLQVDNSNSIPELESQILNFVESIF